MVVVEGGGVGEAELLLHHQLLYSSYYSNTFWFNGESRTIWSVHNDCQIVFRNSKAQKFDTLGLLRKSLSLVSGSWKVLQLLLKYIVPPDTRQLVLSSLF